MNTLLFLPLVLAAAPQGAFTANRAPVSTPAALSARDCEPRIAINLTNTPGDADSQFRITEPGSYYLTKSRTGAAGKSCIEVASDDVQIDLMGFRLTGVPGSLHGIVSDGPHQTIRIHTGEVTDFGESGIDLYVSIGCSVQGIQASSNGVDGVRVGDSGRIVECTSLENGSTGISAGNMALVKDCTSRGNSINGFGVSVSGRLVNCMAKENQGHGFQYSNYVSAQGCTSNFNGGTGFRFGTRCQLSQCSADYNGENGFDGNGGNSHIADCSASSNELFGFDTSHGCYLRGNLSINNGSVGVGGGFNVSGWRSVLESNTSTSNDFVGFKVETAGNFLRGNTASENTLNWSVVGGNVCRVALAATGGGIFGNSGGVAAGVYDPMLNYTF